MTGETKVLLSVGLITLGLFVGGILTLTKKSAPVNSTLVDQTVLVRADSWKKGGANGPENVKVTLVEFGDFQCPFCAQAHLAIEELTTLYPNELVFVSRNFPLSQHKNALLAAEAAESAGMMGKYWEMYDLLYKNQVTWGESVDAKTIFQQYAQQLELNVDQFIKDLDNRTYRTRVQKDIADGNLLGVNSTPTFFVDGQRFSGSMAQLKALVESKLTPAQ